MSLTRGIPHQRVLGAQDGVARVGLQVGDAISLRMQMHHQVVDVEYVLVASSQTFEAVHLDNDLLGAHVCHPRSERSKLASVAIYLEEINFSSSKFPVRLGVEIDRHEVDEIWQHVLLLLVERTIHADDLAVWPRAVQLRFKACVGIQPNRDDQAALAMTTAAQRLLDIAKIFTAVASLAKRRAEAAHAGAQCTVGMPCCIVVFYCIRPAPWRPKANVVVARIPKSACDRNGISRTITLTLDLLDQ